MYITVRISWTFFSRLVSHRQSMKYRYMRHRNVISFGNANVYTSIYSISYIVFPTKFFFFRQVYVIPIRDYEIAFTRETHLGIFYYREYYSFKLFKCSNVYHRKFYDSFIRVRPMKS